MPCDEFCDNLSVSFVDLRTPFLKLLAKRERWSLLYEVN
jgi:hypothetical protein